MFPVFHLFCSFKNKNKNKNGNVFILFPFDSFGSDLKSDSPELIDNNLVTPLYDFDNPSYHAEEEGAEDCDQLELARSLKQEEKMIQPHEERVKFVIPGTAEVRRESEGWGRFRDKSRTEW